MNFKKELPSNITLISVLVLLSAYLVIITLNLFGVMQIQLNENFNYIVAYIFAIISIALYILGFFTTKLIRADLPEWLRVLFYIAFFVFTNVYYFFGLHSNLIAVAIMMFYIGFVVSTLSLTVFYNAQKDDKNRLKSTKKFITSTAFFYGVGACAILEFIITAAKLIFSPNWSMTSVYAVCIEFGSMLLACLVLTLLYYLSLKRKKEFINSCLIVFKSK